jgi:hypothetical protein
MNEQQRQTLEQKKKALRHRLEAQEMIRLLVQDWLPVLHYLTEQGIAYELEYLLCAGEEHYLYLVEAMKEPPLAGYPLQPGDIKRSATFYVQSEAGRLYPSEYQMRYMPKLNHHLDWEEDVAKVLDQACPSVSQDDEVVNFFYCRYAPVVKLRLSDLRKHAYFLYRQDSLAEEVCVVALDFRWMIFRSLEDEWRWGERELEAS